jgi:DNA-binding MarR family transcriptional regulator
MVPGTGDTGLDAWSTHRLLWTAARLDERRVNRKLPHLNLTISAVATLASVAVLGPVPQAGLAREVGVGPQSLGRILQRLETLGLLTRERGRSDERCMIVALTQDGRAGLRRAAEIIRALPHPAAEPATDLRNHLKSLIRELQSGRAGSDTPRPAEPASWRPGTPLPTTFSKKDVP